MALTSDHITAQDMKSKYNKTKNAFNNTINTITSITNNLFTLKTRKSLECTPQYDG